MRGPAQPLQAARPHRADAAHRHPKRPADVGVRTRRIADQHRQQLAAAVRQLSEGGANRGAEFGREHLLVDHRGIGVRRQPVITGQFRVLMLARLPQYAEALTLRGRRQPARQRRRLAQAPDPLDEQQPDTLAHVVALLAAQPVPDADRPDQRGISFDDLVPRSPVPVGRTGNQGDDCRVVTHSPSSHGHVCQRRYHRPPFGQQAIQRRLSRLQPRCEAKPPARCRYSPARRSRWRPLRHRSIRREGL